MSAQSGADIEHLDSLLRNLPDSSRLTTLNELAYKHLPSNSYLPYVRQLLCEAQKQQDPYYEGTAYFLLARYYYSKKPDSMRYFIKLSEPLLIQQNRLEELFRMKGWNIYSLSIEGKREKILPEVDAVREQARRLNYSDGEDVVDQVLANYYMNSGLFEEGSKLYEEVLSRMEKREAPMVKRIHIIRHLLNQNIETEKRIYYLDKLRKYIEECKEKGIKELDAETPLYYIEYLYHRSFALAYIQIKEPKKAYSHLKEAEAIMKKYHLEKMENLAMKNSWLLYYQLMGPHSKIVEVADDLIRILKSNNRMSGLVNILSVKAQAYYEAGQGMEAARVYREYIHLNDSISKAKFYGDLANLKAQHDLDGLELENKEMELQATHTRAQLFIMGGGLALLGLSCILLVYIAWSRHRYSLQLKKAKEVAEEADRMKSAFLANMNHEIRTPLNAIVGFSQVLVEEENPEVRKELADIIQNNNELLQRLITDVLDISKIESNSMSLRYASENLPALMKEIYNMTLLKMPEGVELQLDSCPPSMIETDRNRLTQVLTNLLNNAIKHTHEGFVRLGYQIKDREVCFFVQDSGEGIPADQLENIFSRFVQLSSWSKGVGLGLAICRGLIDKMGGKIEVVSEIGIGSIFYVTVPLSRPDNS